MSAGDIAAIIAVLELPPRFSRSNHVSTESRYGMKSAFFDFLFFDAWKWLNFVIVQKDIALTLFSKKKKQYKKKTYMPQKIMVSEFHKFKNKLSNPYRLRL